MAKDDNKMNIEALAVKNPKKTQHMKPGNVYTVSVETGKHLVEKGLAKETNKSASPKTKGLGPTTEVEKPKDKKADITS